KPPRDRPIAWSGGSGPDFLLFDGSPCDPGQGRAMLMDTRDRGIHRHDPVDLASERRPLLHVGEQVLPDAVARPPAEVLVDRVPAPEPIGQVSPRRSRAEPPRGRL